MSSKVPAHPEQSNDNTQPPAEKRALGPVTSSSIINFLHNRVRALDADELEFLSGATEYASHMAYNLAETASNIGCLINWDEQPGKVISGNFTIGDNVSSLLFVIADQMRVIAELTFIGSDASSTLLLQERSHV